MGFNEIVKEPGLNFFLITFFEELFSIRSSCIVVSTSVSSALRIVKKINGLSKRVETPSFKIRKRLTSLGFKVFVF